MNPSKRTTEEDLLNKLIDYILEDHYDFEVVDNGGARGEDLSVEGMEIRNIQDFKKGLRKILRSEG